MDLFVRASNTLAISMYQKLGYVVYRRVLGYYGPTSKDAHDEEDAFDMRKPCSRMAGQVITPLPKPVQPADVRWD